jgi:hypothetical protein
MAIDWGTWRNYNSNGMRIGLNVSWSAVDSGSSSVTATIEIWTENQYNHDGDSQKLTYGNSISGSKDYTNNQGTGTTTKRDTKTYTYNYSTWGSSPGSATFSASLSLHYWDGGTNPSVSEAYTIPARPGGPPTVSSASATAGIRSATISWTASGNPGISSYSVYRNNDGNQPITWSSGTSTTDTNLGNGQTAYYIVYANSAAGNGYAFTGNITTPSLPSTPGSLTANAGTFGSIGLSWAGSSGSGYTVTYTVSRNGTSLGTTTSTSWNDTTVAPYTAYTYTVTPSTDVGSNTGASLSATSMGGIAKVWNGTSWIVTLPKVWTGAVWADSQARMYDNVGATEEAKWKHGI